MNVITMETFKTRFDLKGVLDTKDVLDDLGIPHSVIERGDIPKAMVRAAMNNKDLDIEKDVQFVGLEVAKRLLGVSDDNEVFEKIKSVGVKYPRFNVNDIIHHLKKQTRNQTRNFLENLVVGFIRERPQACVRNSRGVFLRLWDFRYYIQESGLRTYKTLGELYSKGIIEGYHHRKTGKHSYSVRSLSKTGYYFIPEEQVKRMNLLFANEGFE